MDRQASCELRQIAYKVKCPACETVAKLASWLKPNQSRYEYHQCEQCTSYFNYHILNKEITKKGKFCIIYRYVPIVYNVTWSSYMTD